MQTVFVSKTLKAN